MKGGNKYIRESFRLYLPPAVGYNFILLLRMLRHYGVDRAYLGRAAIISLISMIGVPFRLYEKAAYDRKAARVELREPPVFILGHWRSGTTHLHNLLCQDPRASYVTTYQSVFPDQTLSAGARFLFKNIMKMLIPINRKGDNVKLGTDYPQEEEFTLGARYMASYYFFWYFPNFMLEYYDEFLTFDRADEKTLKRLEVDYRRVINKSMLYSGKDRFLSKNPVHTGRIPWLLKMYPDARFIFIYRNPVDVILSTRHFFGQMMPGLTLQDVDYKKLNQEIYTIYNSLMKRYLETRHLIPEGNLLEISYKDLSSNTIGEIEKIYRELRFGNFEEAKPAIASYADSKKDYVKNKYAIKRELLEEILSHVDFAMKEWAYDVPDNLEITD